ncbi:MULTISPECIES: C4-dicarboxylate TRAP transporter substrate-binding protein [unclassified Minwuia]|jgi:TRAP-type transport system periplasmic protein|uniref:C4-dicarboxylate TRAP transporter substrate-binding protein n=1 Tax=unclassified Minwuia TaxID=2618799 RepID=UPI00247AFAC8|nr:MULTISPECIES: C4-dicarboxylate TRAP transporter substrate-binding protein [unclassified Minwuia]
MMFSRKTVLAAAGAAMLATAGAAQAETLKLAVGFPTGSAAVYALENFAKNVEATSDLKVKVFSLSLLNLKETPPGIRDGIADMGFVLPPYYPAEFAEINLAANLSMLATTGKQIASPGTAMGAAMTEYVFLHCPDCLTEQKRQNQVYLGTGTSPTYILHCTTPIRTMEDLKGKKYRSGAANFGRWAEAVGGTKVSVPGNDIYEAMAQGVVDCGMFSATELTNLQLFDVTKYITTKIPGGVFAGVATNSINRDVWAGLNDAQREAIFKASARSSADVTWKYYADAKRNLNDAPGKGIEIIEPTAEMVKMSEDFVKSDLAVISKQFTEDYGLSNVDAKIAKISELIEKYKGLTAGMEDDAEALAQLYWDEIMSKVDLSTYGRD